VAEFWSDPRFGSLSTQLGKSLGRADRRNGARLVISRVLTLDVELLETICRVNIYVSASFTLHLFTSHPRCDFVLRHVKQVPSRHTCEQIERPRDGSCPSGLVPGAKTGSVVAVEILVEQYAISPVRVFLKLLAST
jgi:hypothetical protein